MYPRSFLCEEAKIKQRTPLKEEFCEIGEEAIWESRLTSFSFIYQFSCSVVLYHSRTRRWWYSCFPRRHDERTARKTLEKHRSQGQTFSFSKKEIKNLSTIYEKTLLENPAIVIYDSYKQFFFIQ